jgi:hypothetical protein
MTAASQTRAGVRDVLRVVEFRALLGSSALSITGDQVARVAVSLLVYGRTHSAFAAAATYALSYLTWLLGGLVLSTVADRQPRRRLMITCDVLRAGAVALLVLPDVPLPVVFGVLAVVGVLSPPFDAAKSAVLPEVLTGDRYVVGNGLQSSLFQAANAAGFLLGGSVVAVTGVRTALALDAVSFLLSAALVGGWVRERPLPAAAGGSLLADTAAGIGLVARDRRLRRLLAYGLLGAVVLITPEGLAVPVAGALRDGARSQAFTTGVLTAVAPAGFLLGSVALLRLSPARRGALLPWLVAGSGAALVLTPFASGPAAVAVLWLAAGAGSALTVVANAAYMQAVPDHMRARAFGVANTALMVLQGVLLLALGGLAEALDPLVVAGLLGLVALLAVLPLAGSTRTGAHARTAP